MGYFAIIMFMSSLIKFHSGHSYKPFTMVAYSRNNLGYSGWLHVGSMQCADIMTLIMATFSITTHSITIFSITIMNSDTQHKKNQHTDIKSLC
jgi:hypothetical protein